MPLPTYKSGSTLVDKTRAQVFNLAVLQRLDDQIQEILYSATHVAVYEFDTKGKYWKRSNIEGTLFLVKRRSQPRCQIMVLNGKGTDNFYEEVDGSLETEMLDTFLLYTKGNNQLYGIWFYEDKNCDEFAEYLNKILRAMPRPARSGILQHDSGDQLDTKSSGNTTASGNNNSGEEGGGATVGSALWDMQKPFCQPVGRVPNGDVGGGGTLPSNGLGGQGNTVGNGTGEENQLLRLFREAMEKNPTAPEQQSALTQSPPQPLQAHRHQPPAPERPSTVLTASQMPQQASQMGGMIQVRHPSPVPVRTIGLTTSQEIAPLRSRSVTPPPPSISMPVQGPLPPEFFKSSLDIGFLETQSVGSSFVAPDPTLLPMPSIPNLMPVSQSSQPPNELLDLSQANLRISNSRMDRYARRFLF